MAYPTSYDTFITKKDKGETISAEPQTVPGSPYIVVTNYAILQSVSIPGYTEVLGTPGPGEFRVDYRTSNIYFNATNTGASISITYITTGSPIRASDVNSLQTSIVNIEGTLGLDPQGAYTTVRERLDAISASTAVGHVDWYVPTGTVDGSNNTFGLASAPNPSDSLEVRVNGLHVERDVEYIVDGLNVVFISGQVPEVGDTLHVKYRL